MIEQLANESIQSHLIEILKYINIKKYINAASNS